MNHSLRRAGIQTLALLCGLSIGASRLLAAESIPIHSPGFPPSALDAEGRLVETWGALDITVRGDGLSDAPVVLDAIQLDGLVPAARASADHGAVRLIRTAFRAPAFPAGLDVLTVRVEEVRGQPAEVTLGLVLPAQAVIGLQTVRVGSRAVLVLPAEGLADRPQRAWGYCDEATSLPRWAKPAVKCDAAFANIRAGLGGVPILYRFQVPAGSEATVALGWCESHWAEAGQRPLACRVEGATEQTVDPVARWGQHKPGVILFRGRDQNTDGRLEVTVRAAAGARDRNPILNAIWLFPAGESPDPEQLLAGSLSSAATRYVDVGGENDQSIYPPGNLEYRLSLPAGGVQELNFLVACQDGSLPSPETSSWTAASLRRAALEVWRDWPER